MVFIQGTAVVYEEDVKSFNYQSSTISFSGIADRLLQAKTPFSTPDNAFFLTEKGKIEYACAGCYSYSFSIKH